MNPRDMMDIFENWDEDKRLKALYKGCQMALSVWKDYTRDNTIQYIDSLVALEHVVENDLPMDAMNAIKSHIDGKEPKDVEEIDRRYREPITAMQDYDWYSTDEFDLMDLHFPQHVEYAYYSIYNLFRLLFNDIITIEEPVIINQFISSQLSYDDGITEEEKQEQIDAAFQKWWDAVTGF
ncbi:MAG: hypothetical protein ACFFCS_17515 [Candidatus Hodarchaeota archaeon]